MKTKCIITFFITLSLIICTTYVMKSNGNFHILISKRSGNGNIDSSNVELILKKVKYKKFINQPIGRLLDHIPSKYERIQFVQMHPLKLAFVSVIYSREISLDIYTEKYSYIKRILEEGESENVWKIEDLLKEKVSKIRVRNNINGNSLKEYPKKPILPVI